MRVKKWLLQLKAVALKVRDFLDEKTLASIHLRPVSRMHRFAHFWLMVVKGFSRNRCFMQASGLAYTSLLSIIPMLYVAVSISTSLLKQEGGQRVNHFVDKLLLDLTPPTTTAPSTNKVSSVAGATNTDLTNEDTATDAKPAGETTETNVVTGASAETRPRQGRAQFANNREQLVHTINGLITNIQGGTLGVTGLVVLIVMAVSLLHRIETTFNDIWGVKTSRNWLARIIQYWAILSLGPLLLAAGLALTNSSHMQPTRDLIHSLPIVPKLYRFAPMLLLCLTLSVLYSIIPYCKVNWTAALIGGTVSGVLWHLNNYLSVYYVSRWVTYSNIYGNLAIIPILMIGLYFSWLILLFGAQISQAFQNRQIYLQEKQAENINQRGREFIALRLMELVGERFYRSLPPAGARELARDLLIPECLAEDTMEVLAGARLIVAGAGDTPAYVPARPLEDITCHDILLAMRTGQGQELSTRDEPARTEVFGEFEKIVEAEKKAADAVTVLMMVNRSGKKELAAPARAASAKRQIEH